MNTNLLQREKDNLAKIVYPSVSRFNALVSRFHKHNYCPSHNSIKLVLIQTLVMNVYQPAVMHLTSDYYLNRTRRNTSDKSDRWLC